MKLFELQEPSDREAHINPLNDGAVDDQFHDVMDIVDEIHHTLNLHLYPDPNQRTSNTIGQRMEHIHKLEQEWFPPTSVPISTLSATEPDYDPNHVKKITNQQSGKLPRVYESGAKRFIGDGNHRVLAAYFAGEKNIKVNLINVPELERRVEELVKG